MLYFRDITDDMTQRNFNSYGLIYILEIFVVLGTILVTVSK